MPPASLFGILNITADLFSDGGRLLDPAAAMAQARRLARTARMSSILGAAASNVAAEPVAPEEEIRRLDPVVAALHEAGIAVSVDSFQPETQRFALARGVDYLNDISGFADPSLYPELAAARAASSSCTRCRDAGRAQQRRPVGRRACGSASTAFFAARLAALKRPESPASG